MDFNIIIAFSMGFSYLLDLTMVQIKRKIIASFILKISFLKNFPFYIKTFTLTFTQVINHCFNLLLDKDICLTEEETCWTEGKGFMQIQPINNIYACTLMHFKVFPMTFSKKFLIFLFQLNYCLPSDLEFFLILLIRFHYQLENGNFLRV